MFGREEVFCSWFAPTAGNRTESWLLYVKFMHGTRQQRGHVLHVYKGVEAAWQSS